MSEKPFWRKEQTFRLALAAGVKPVRLAQGARLAARFGGITDPRVLWPQESARRGEVTAIAALFEE